MSRLLSLLVVAFGLLPEVTATTYAIQSHYVGTTCDGTPYIVSAEETSNCTTEVCSTNDGNSSTVMAEMVSVECTSDYISTMREKFKDAPYILQVSFQDENCSTFSSGYGFPASGNCEGSFNETGSFYAIGSLNSNGSTSIQYFSANPCLLDSWYMTQSANTSTLSSHQCDASWLKWYSSNDASSDSGSGGVTITANAIIGLVLGCLAVILVILAVKFWRQRVHTKSLEYLPKWAANLQSDRTATLVDAPLGQTGLWNDDVITANRISRDKVVVKKLLSRGAYGEVYSGTFNRHRVAIKMLLPATRSQIHYVDEFLAETKMTALMDHPHIITFIGVAWNSLTDLCVVLEFMESGDLRTLLSSYESTKQPTGFNRQKATIALHICHALTYLHSLDPPVIHRDLKSRNVLLDSKMNAKLSDFGISRERLDHTMTACVGTSLWMAPEVMMGERYDVKADIFSFGVVLSELDVHTLPYAGVSRQGVDSNGHQVTGVTLFQRIAVGTVKVDFSDSSPQSVVELGRACMSLDPFERPTAAEALYRLQRIVAHDLVISDF